MPAETSSPAGGEGLPRHPRRQHRPRPQIPQTSRQEKGSPITGFDFCHWEGSWLFPRWHGPGNAMRHSPRVQQICCLAACRTKFHARAGLEISAILALELLFRKPISAVFGRCGACPGPGQARFGRNPPHLACWARLRVNIRLRFHAMVTRLHSPRTLSRPRVKN